MSTDLGLDAAIQELSEQVTAGIAADDLATCLRKIVAFFDKGFGSAGNPFGSAALADKGMNPHNVPVLDANGKLAAKAVDLGTAAELDAGTDPGNVPVLDEDGNIPASALDLGTAAKLDAGTAEGDIPVLGHGGKLSSRFQNRLPKTIFHAPFSQTINRFGTQIYPEPRYTRIAIKEMRRNFKYLDFDFTIVVYRGSTQYVQLNTVRVSTRLLNEASFWYAKGTLTDSRVAIEAPMPYSSLSSFGVIIGPVNERALYLDLCTTPQHYREQIFIQKIKGITT